MKFKVEMELNITEEVIETVIEIDSVVADMTIQYSCFGEIIYG